jgi:hypothetical protein
LALVWVRFFTIVNNDGQSLASFSEKNIFAGQEPEVRSQNPELGGAGGMTMDCPLGLFPPRTFQFFHNG